MFWYPREPYFNKVVEMMNVEDFPKDSAGGLNNRLPLSMQKNEILLIFLLDFNYRGDVYYTAEVIYMKRSQVYLLDNQWQKLVTLSKQTGQSVAQLVRVAIDKVYIKKNNINFELALRKGFGIWENRIDIENTDKYVRNLRIDKRINRLYDRHSD